MNRQDWTLLIEIEHMLEIQTQLFVFSKCYTHILTFIYKCYIHTLDDKCKCYIGENKNVRE